MTVMAGFIDVHRHLIYGPPERYFAEQAVDRMRELLEAGFTTVQAGGDDNAAILELKHRVERGEIKGPRILAADRIVTGRLNSDEEVRNAIRAAKSRRLRFHRRGHLSHGSSAGAADEKETHNLAIALDEAAKVGIPVQIHAVSPANMVAAVSIGGKKLIHTPHFDWVTEAQADQVKAPGRWCPPAPASDRRCSMCSITTTSPPFATASPGRRAVISNEGQGREGGFLPINGRTLFDHGVVYAYCTDTNFNATAALNQELKTLNVAFSTLDIIKIMGPDSAEFLDRGKDLGTVQPGKIADMVLLGGNPLVGYWNFMTTEVVIKGGSDRARQARQAQCRQADG